MENTLGLRSDLEELESLLKVARRPSIIRMLTEQCQRLRDQIQEAEKLEKCAAQGRPTAEVFNTIDRFAWDQTPALVKVYVHLDGLNDLSPDATCVRFEENSAELVVRNLRQKNYTLKFSPLYAPVDTEKSNFTVKRDTVTIRLAKLRPGEHWDSVAKATQANAMPKLDPSADPSESIMSMMKSLYNEGDSEMKRTIAKAWTESQERKMKGIQPGDGIF
ncbi:calcyclin binding protein, putative [Eimeria maxima]|uniref:Calcyclin-binding protein n=1 Tax=Eimeria maxima TaxID=5804 RepID=U6ME55_EIMMA|nr:calcyclin binding protein, putative [Eimeria maxima]CDJ59955.1 calcyclin binding protein, putative [Eimeria maxima]